MLAVQVSNNEKAVFEIIKKEPSTKDVTISKRLEKLKKCNNKHNNDSSDGDNDDDDDGDFLGLPTPPSLVSRSNEFDSEFDSDDKKLTPTQKFLLVKPQKEKLAVAVGENEIASTAQLQEKTTAKKVKFSNDLTKIFPEENEIVKSNKIQNINEKDEILILNAQEMIAKLDWGKLTDQLKFFEGDGSKKDLPLQKMRKCWWLI